MWPLRVVVVTFVSLAFLNSCARESPEVTNARMWQAIIKGDTTTVVKSLSQGADPNLSTAEGVSALMLAASTGNTRAVEALLSKGARPNEATNEHHLTALMFAGKACSRDIAEILVAAKAEAKLTDSGKGSAADWAFRGCMGTKEAANLIEYLHERGASILPRGDAIGVFFAEASSPPMDSLLESARLQFPVNEDRKGA